MHFSLLQCNACTRQYHQYDRRRCRCRYSKTDAAMQKKTCFVQSVISNDVRLFSRLFAWWLILCVEKRSCCFSVCLYFFASGFHCRSVNWLNRCTLGSEEQSAEFSRKFHAPKTKGYLYFPRNGGSRFRLRCRK